MSGPMEMLNSPDQFPGAMQGVMWLYKVRNTSEKHIPPEGSDPLTFNANDGYNFAPGGEKILREDEADFLCQKVPSLKVVAVDKQDGKGFETWPPKSGGMRQGGLDGETFIMGTDQEMDGFGGEAFRQQQVLMRQMTESVARTEELNARLERKIKLLDRKLERLSTKKKRPTSAAR